LRRNQNSFGQLRLQGELAHHLSDSGELALVVECAENIEQLEGPHHGLRGGRVHEVKVHQIGNAQFFQSEHNGGQIRPQNLGVIVRHQLLVVGLLREQPEALPGLRSTGSALRVNFGKIPLFNRPRPWKSG
jgi:hypothetical protein